MTRKLMATAAVVLFAVPTFVQAQAATAVTSTATVAPFFEVTGAGSIAFNTLSRGSDNVVDAAGGAGAAQRSVAFNHNVKVTFENVPTNLVSGPLNLPISLTCARRVSGTWNTAAACSGASFDLTVGSSLTTVTLGFGGTISAAAASNAVAGSYQGTMDIVVVAR
jgi:hypothetical protein